MIKLLARFSACLATLIAVVAAIWATGALYFDIPAPFVIRIVAAAVLAARLRHCVVLASSSSLVSVDRWSCILLHPRMVA